VEDSSKPYPFFLAHPLGKKQLDELGDSEDWAVNGMGSFRRGDKFDSFVQGDFVLESREGTVF